MSAGRLEHFGELLRHLREPLLVVSRDGRVLAASVAGADTLGTVVRALEGVSLATYSPDPVDLAAKLQLSEDQQFQLRARRDRRITCEASALSTDLLLVRLSGGPGDDPRARVFVDTLSRLSGIVSVDTPELEEVCGALLTQAVSSLDAMAAMIFLIDEAGANLELTFSASMPEEHADRYRLIPLTANLPIVDTVKSIAPMFLGSLDDYLVRYRDYAEMHPEIAQNGLASLPLEVEGRCIGALVVGFRSPWMFSPEERVFLSALAHQCAQSIARARRRDASPSTKSLPDHAALRLERLHVFTGALAQATSPAEVVDAIVEMGLATTTAARTGLWLLSKDGRSLCLARSLGTNAPRPEHFDHVPLDAPTRFPMLDAVVDGVPAWLESQSQLQERYPEFVHRFSKGKEASLACIPLFAEGRCIGGISYGFDGVHRFLEDERSFLQLMSWYSAQAIERARLYAAERRAKEEAVGNKERSDFLADVGAQLASSLDLQHIREVVARAAVPHFADWCNVELADARRTGSPPVAVHADASKAATLIDLCRQMRGLGNFEAGITAVIRTGRSIHLPIITREMVEAAAAADATLLELVLEIGVASAIIVPISARGSVLGAILLVRSSPGCSYDERDLSMAEDLGRRVGLAVDNARLYQEARDADRLKDEFLAMLGHELRNPLAPIVTALEVMNLRGDSSFDHERAVISRHVQHVVKLVDDLLDVSRITQGKVQLVKRRHELSLIVGAAVEMVGPLLRSRHHRLEVAVPESGLPIIADHARLTQAITNLLNNAAKYTEPGGEIAVVAVQDGTDAVVRVRDSGIGIPPDLLPRIFDLFVQADSTLDRAQGGLGIGLTVVKSMASLHGGSVAAFSAGPGNGSELVLRIPLAPAEVPLTQSTTTGAAQRPTIGRRVAIVDDNRDAAALLGVALESLGCSTQIFHDGPSALAAAPTFKPELMLLDIGLPVMDGYELARRVREIDATPSLRLVAITGYGQESDRLRSREAGFDEHIVKPVSLDVLRRVLEG